MLTRKRSCSRLRSVSLGITGLRGVEACALVTTSMLSAVAQAAATLTRTASGHSQCVHVGRKTGEAIVQGVVDGEHLLKVHGDTSGLVTETEVAGNRDTVLADHGDDRTAVVLLDGLWVVSSAFWTNLRAGTRVRARPCCLA